LFALNHEIDSQLTMIFQKI